MFRSPKISDIVLIFFQVEILITNSGTLCMKKTLRLTPLAVRMGFAFNLGTSTLRYWGGTAAMMSTRRGCAERPYLAAVLVLILKLKAVQFRGYITGRGNLVLSRLFGFQLMSVHINIWTCLDKRLLMLWSIITKKLQVASIIYIFLQYNYIGVCYNKYKKGWY